MPKKYHTDLPDDLAEEFDKIISSFYLNDAEAVRDSIRHFVKQWKEGKENK